MTARELAAELLHRGARRLARLGQRLAQAPERARAPREGEPPAFELVLLPHAEGGPVGAFEEVWSSRWSDLELLLLRRPGAGPAGTGRWFWQIQEEGDGWPLDASPGDFRTREEAEADLRLWARMFDTGVR